MTIPATRLTNTGNHFINGIYDEATGISPIVDSSLILYLDAGRTDSYPGTGNTWYDLSGNGNNGTLYGNPYSYANGGSIFFNSYNYVSLGGPAALSPQQLTVSMWFKYLGNPQNNIGGGILIRNRGYGWSMSTSTATNGSYGLNAAIYNTSSNTVSSGNFGSLSLGTYYNLTIIFGNSIFTVYLNGVSVYTTTATANSIYYSGSQIAIGRDGDSPNSYFNGIIPHVLMYNRGLSATEVIKNYNALAPRYGTPTVPTVNQTVRLIANTSSNTYATSFTSGYDEFTGLSVVDSSLKMWIDAGNPASYSGTGTTVYDLSGNANNLTLVGNPPFNSNYFNFNGINQNANGTFTWPSDFTVNIWIIPIACKSLGDARIISTSPSDNFEIAYNNINQLMYYSVSSGWTYTGIILNNSSWTNLCFVKSGTTLKFYQNGVLIYTGIIGATIGGSSIFIAQRYNFVESAIMTFGLLQIYNRVLSATEIQQNYNALNSRYGLTPISGVNTTISQRTANTGIMQIAGSFDEVTGMPVMDSSLKLWLDAGQTTSYPGSGNTWYDISGNGNNFTLVGSPTPISNGLAFSGNNWNPQWAYCNNTTCGNFDANSFTIEYCVSTLGNTRSGYDAIISKRSNITSVGANGGNGWGYRNGSATLFFQDSNSGAGSPGTAYPYISGITTPTQITHHAITMTRTGLNAITSLYINNVLFAGASANTTFVGDGLITNGMPIYLMSPSGSYNGLSPLTLIGNLYFVKIYNRALSTQELTQNFNAIRGRYGI